jgi:hypothetical protein
MDRKLEWLDGYFEETRSVSGTEWAVIRNSCRSQQEAMGGKGGREGGGVLIAAEPPACPGKKPSTKNERERKRWCFNGFQQGTGVARRTERGKNSTTRITIR